MHRNPQDRPIESDRNLRLQEAYLVTTVKATALVAQSVKGLLTDQPGHAVGQLHLVAGAAFQLGQVADHRRHQDVTPDD